MGLWYRARTVTATSGSNLVVGVNTFFTLNCSVGDAWTTDGTKLYEITAITNDTNITLSAAYTGATASGLSYAIIRNFTGTTNATLAEKLTTLLNRWQTREDLFATWNAGTVYGGPNGNGTYPLANAIGQTQNAACPARLEFLTGQVKPSVRAASVANLTLSAAQTVDGVALVAGDRCLVKNQTAGAENGIYIVAAGAWTRATDFDTSSDAVAGCLVAVDQGSTNAGTIWMMSTNAPITLGTTALAFTKIYPDPLKADLAGSATQNFTAAALSASGDIKSSAANPLFQGLSSTGSAALCNDNAGAFIRAYGSAHATNANVIGFEAGGAERARITSTGNALFGTTTDDAVNKLQVNGSAKVSGHIGIAITPNAWAGAGNIIDSSVGAVRFGTGSLEMIYNAYFNGTNWICKTAGPTLNCYLNASGFVWTAGPTGTAGGIAPAAPAVMTLAPTGNLLIGTTTDDAVNKLQVNGSGSFAGGLSAKSSGASRAVTALGGGDTDGKGNFKTADAGNASYWTFGRDNQLTGDFVLYSGAAKIASFSNTGLTITGQYNLSALNTAPASATATGTLGEVRVTAGHIYVCTATNTWVRAALGTW